MNSPMDMLTRVRDAAAGVPRATGSHVRRARLKMQRRRLESKLRSEMAALGEDLYGRFESGEPLVESPAAQDRLADIASLRLRIDALGHTERLAARVRESIADTDHNATSEASAEQVLGDVADRRAGSPAEQGGEG